MTNGRDCHPLTNNRTPIARSTPRQHLQRPIAIRPQHPKPDSAERLPRDLARRRHLGHALGARDIVQRGADQRGALFFGG